MDASGILALLGGVAIFVSLFGGGIEIERLKIPVVSGKIRLFSALVGALLIGIAIWISNPQILQSVPQGTTTSIPTLTPRPEQNLTILDDFNEDKFNEEKWFFDWFGRQALDYSIEQNGGQACFKFNNVTQDNREFVIRSKFSEPIDIFEVTIASVSGNGEFGLDMNDGQDWDNFLIDGNGRIRISYGSFDPGKDLVYSVKNIIFQTGLHKLSVIYGPYEARFLFDDTQVWSRPVQGILKSVGFDIRINANTTLTACVESVQARFIK